MIAEAEVGSDATLVAREDDGVIVGEPVVAIIDEVAVVVHRCKSGVPVEDVVVRQSSVYSPARIVGILATLIGIARTELGEKVLMRTDLIGKARLLQSAHYLIARPFSAPVAHEGVDVRPIEGLGQPLGLGIVPRPTRVLGSDGIRQTPPEALRNGVAHFVKLGDPVAHLLAVGRYHIFSVGEHPVESATAPDYVLARGFVVDAEHVVAPSAGESVLHGVVVFAANQ